MYMTGILTVGILAGKGTVLGMMIGAVEVIVIVAKDMEKNKSIE
jgi:hypothetical protein